MHLSLVSLVCILVVTLGPGSLGYKVDPSATKPPVPPPPPPQIRFRNSFQPVASVTPATRAEVFELIAPNQIQGGFNPSLTLGNPDFMVGYRPQQTRPKPQRPQQPYRPQRPSRPQRPQQRPPQRPQQRPPQRPNSQFVARPTVPVPPRPQG